MLRGREDSKNFIPPTYNNPPRQVVLGRSLSSFAFIFRESDHEQQLPAAWAINKTIQVIIYELIYKNDDTLYCRHRRKEVGYSPDYAFEGLNKFS
jgi:hypothetical protein